MTPAELREMYREEIAEHGKSVLVRRYSGTGTGRTATDVTVRARVMGYNPERLAGTIKQGAKRVIALAEDLEGSAITLPLRVGDKIVDEGKELNIEGPDDSTREVAGVLIAYDLMVLG